MMSDPERGGMDQTQMKTDGKIMTEGGMSGVQTLVRRGFWSVMDEKGIVPSCCMGNSPLLPILPDRVFTQYRCEVLCHPLQVACFSGMFLELIS